MRPEEKVRKRKLRARRHHAKARLSGRPRLIVFRSLRAIYAQIMDDTTGKVLCGTSNLKGKSGIEGAREVGKAIAKLAQEKGVKAVAFDRNGYKYHGQVKALAEGAREGGLDF